MFTLAGIMNILDAGLAARHPRHRRRAPDDRRRVRSFHRLHGGFAGLIFGGLRRRWGCRCWLAILATFAVRGRARRAQRPDRHPHRPAVLHRHAGLPVHPARPVAGRAEMGHRRLDADARHRRAVGRRIRCARSSPATRLEGLFAWLAAHDLIAQIPERHADRHGRPGLDRLVHPRSRCSPPGSCCARAPATGSSPPAAMPMRRAIPACRCDRVKIGLFMLTAVRAALVAVLTVLDRRLDRRAARLPEGVRGHHRGGDRRLPAHRRLRLGHRRRSSAPSSSAWCRIGSPTPVRHRLVPGLPRRHAAARRAVQQLHPPAR